MTQHAKTMGDTHLRDASDGETKTFKCGGSLIIFVMS